MTDFEIRPAKEDEMGQIGLLTSYVYGGTFGDGEDNVTTRNNRPEWTLCAFDGTTLAASYAAIPFTMRANGRAMAMAGVTIVGTLPEYRRQGLLRRITEQSFLDMMDRGQTVAALWASQAAIYQRYGYSLCSIQRRYEIDIDTVDVNLLVDAAPGWDVQRSVAAESFSVVKELYRDFVADRSLYLHRSTPLWQANALAEREADGPVHIALCHDPEGRPQGYVVYTLREGKVNHPARGQEIVIRDMVWLHIDACRALWAFLGKHDLVGRILWANAPVDDPAWELMQEPRMLNARESEGVYFRIIDVQGALGARGYDRDGELIIGLETDRETPWNQGSWRLTVSGGEAEVSRVSSAADITFRIKSLSAAFSGFRRVRQLAAWGLVEGSVSAIDRADGLLATRHAPHSPDHF
jgi:predicted acetyltransferase